MKEYDRLKKNAVVAIYAVAVVLSAVFLFTGNFHPIRLLYAAVGFFIVWIFSAFLHEICHFIAAKLCGFKTLSLSFSIFSFDFVKKKFSFRYSPYLGEISVFPHRKRDFVKAYSRIIFGGIAGSFIAAAATLVGFTAIKGDAAYLFCFFPVSFALFLINAIPYLLSDNDATVLCRLSKDRVYADNYMEILHGLKAGDTYEDIDEAYFDIPPKGTLFDSEICVLALRRAYEEGNAEKAAEAVSRLKETDLSDEGKTELLFYYLSIGDESEIERRKEDISLTDDMDEPYKIRTALLYAEWRGDSKYAETLYPTFVKACKETFIRGDGRFNLKYIKR